MISLPCTRGRSTEGLSGLSSEAAAVVVADRSISGYRLASVTCRLILVTWQLFPNPGNSKRSAANLPFPP